MIRYHDIHDFRLVIVPFTPDLMSVWRDDSTALLIKSIVSLEIQDT
jgi:hypothetical protein